LQEISEKQPVNLIEALLPLFTLGGLLVLCAVFLELNGQLLVLVILASAAVAGIIALRHGATWDDIQRVTGERFASVLPVILILLAIGMLIGTWVVSGTIPYIVYGSCVRICWFSQLFLRPLRCRFAPGHRGDRRELSVSR
jgi:NhaC family Na+:H+ antiporter